MPSEVVGFGSGKQVDVELVTERAVRDEWVGGMVVVEEDVQSW